MNFKYEIIKDEAVITGVANHSIRKAEIPSEIDGYPVTSIGEYAFYNCTSLESITIPDSVTSIDYGVFRDCTSLASKKGVYKAFKLMNGELFCMNYKFSVGEWADVIKKIRPCESGYHFCTNLFEIFNYYSGELDKDIAIYECEVGDEIIDSETSKCVTNKIKPVKRLSRLEVIRILNGEKYDF